MEKFEDDQIQNHDDVVNVLSQEPLFDEIKEDIKEPKSIDVVLDHSYTAWNLMSQGAMTMSKYAEKDLLHCSVSSAAGERVTLASPYQRGGLEIGRPISLPKANQGPPPGMDDGGQG